MKKKTVRKSFLNQLEEKIQEDRISFAVYIVLRIIVLGILIRSAFNSQWESVFVCVLTLILFLLPPFVEKTFKIRLPTTLEVIAFLFIFCAEILGEINLYYEKIPIWDSMLHTVNGFLFAAVGFSLVDIFNKNKIFKFQLSPIFLAIVAFCFSMTIGVMWEFFEFMADFLLRTDMQKDFVLNSISTVLLDPARSNSTVLLNGIESTKLLLNDGSVVEFAGYIDVGLFDTMKDLFVNFIGALIFSIIGYFYVKHRGSGRIANQFIPVSIDECENVEDTENDTEA